MPPSNSTNVRWVSFADRTVAIHYDNHPELVALLAFLFDDIPANPAIPPHQNYQLKFQNNQFTLHRAEDEIYLGRSIGKLASLLLANTGYHLADTCDGGLFFHAAGLSWNNQAVMLPGQSGAGKTTFITWLMTRGFHYLTDEFVFIPDNDIHVQSFCRPLNLKPASRPVIQPFFDYEAHAEDIISLVEADIVPPRLIGGVAAGSRPPLTRIIFPKYTAGQPLTLKRLSKAQTGLWLMQTLINARNLPKQGFPQITKLAQTVPAYQLEYDNFAQLGHKIEELWG